VDDAGRLGLASECGEGVQNTGVGRFLIGEKDKGAMRERRLEGEGGDKGFAEGARYRAWFKVNGVIEDVSFSFLMCGHGA
jgi:hypothetical protein